MSYNSHRRALLDEARPLAHRASHARSCALHVANKLHCKREEVIALVFEQTGVDLHQPESDVALLQAFAALEALRKPGS